MGGKSEEDELKDEQRRAWKAIHAMQIVIALIYNTDTNPANGLLPRLDKRVEDLSRGIRFVVAAVIVQIAVFVIINVIRGAGG